MNKPYSTSNFAYDRSHNRFGYGVYIINNKAGIGNYNTLNFIW